MTAQPLPADQPENMARAIAVLLAGGVVAFPTETVYGLGAMALNREAVEKIFLIKGRPSTNPLIVHVSGVPQAKELVAEWPDVADDLAKMYWPGPLTLVLKKNPLVPDEITAGADTVAIRCPANAIAQALISATGPLAAPSANRSGELSPTTAAHVARSLGDAVPVILDGGPCEGGLESTVIDLSLPKPRLLRPGLLDRTKLESTLGLLELGTSSGSGAMPSPGMLARHYAPRTALECANSAEEADFLVNLYETAGLKVARYVPPTDPVQAALRLYADLHHLDTSGFDRIIATLPVDDPAWQAIRDRLLRASAEE
jgi:L-threonylcarbamoyladenylate synthase